MYGTVARMRIKPGMEATMTDQLRMFEAAKVPGAKAVYMYRTDANPSEYYMAVVFESKEAYLANANSADQQARYQEYMRALDGPPEWHDGEIVASAIL
jgi:quinol monooxygenase YgiN